MTTYKKEDIRVMTEKESKAFFQLNRLSEEGTYRPLGMFKLKEDDMWVGIDNRAGDAFVEEFHEEETCDLWLIGEVEIDDI